MSSTMPLFMASSASSVVLQCVSGLPDSWEGASQAIATIWQICSAVKVGGLRCAACRRASALLPGATPSLKPPPPRQGALRSQAICRAIGGRSPGLSRVSGRSARCWNHPPQPGSAREPLGGGSSPRQVRERLALTLGEYDRRRLWARQSYTPRVLWLTVLFIDELSISGG